MIEAKKILGLDEDGIEVITDMNFEEKVLQNEKPVMVEFTIDFCTPCQQLRQSLNNLYEQYHDQVDFYSVHINHDKKLTNRYNVLLYPTLILFNKGIQMGCLTGTDSTDMINKKLLCLLR